MSKVEIIRPGESVLVDPASSGLAHGFGVFETIRVAEGRIEFWDAHWTRLRASAQCLGIAAVVEPECVLGAVRELCGELGVSDLTVKLSLLQEAAGVRVLVYSRPAFSSPAEVGLLVDSSHVLNEQSLVSGLKTHNYLENMMLMNVARAQGCYDLVRFDSKARIAEGAISNLFWARAGRVFTSDSRTGLLPGVVRQAILTEMDIDVGFFKLSDLLEADEVFVVNSSVGALSVEWLLFEGERISVKSDRATVGRQLGAAIQRQLAADCREL